MHLTRQCGTGCFLPPTSLARSLAQGLAELQPSPTICNLRLYSTGISPLAALAFRSHLLSTTHMSCPGRDCGFDITQAFTPRWLTPRCWQDITKFGHVQSKDSFLAWKSLRYGRWCHSKWQWLYGIQLSTIYHTKQSCPTAHTVSNLKLSNMGTSPFAFLWHLLGMMHMSCILLMISCCSPTLQICQSGLVSIPGLCLQSATTASTWLLPFSASSTCRRWIRQHAHTHSHQNGWQDMTKFGHVQTKHCFLPSKPLSCGRWCHSKWQWLYGIQLSTIRLSVKTNSSYW